MVSEVEPLKTLKRLSSSLTESDESCFWACERVTRNKDRLSMAILSLGVLDMAEGEEGGLKHLSSES